MKEKIDRTGEINFTPSGKKITILHYYNSKDMTIQFENGCIIEHIPYRRFKDGLPRISQKYEHIGEKRKANNNMTMKLIEWKSTNDVTIQFDDNTIVYHKRYAHFLEGTIENPNIKRKPRFQDRTGETNVASNGLKMTIIAYRNANDIDIQFEDGIIVQHKRYKEFTTGRIKNPNYKKTYHIINKGRLGEKQKNTKGLMMKIIAYRKAIDIDVQFEDGTIIHHTSYGNFKKGQISNPNADEISNHINETAIANNGLKMTIIKIIKNQQVDIQFEDGTIIHNRNYTRFKKGEIKHPSLRTTRCGNGTGKLYHTKLSGIAHRYNNITHYFCDCPICGEHKIWTFEQIKHHTCNLPLSMPETIAKPTVPVYVYETI